MRRPAGRASDRRRRTSATDRDRGPRPPGAASRLRLAAVARPPVFGNRARRDGAGSSRSRRCGRRPRPDVARCDDATSATNDSSNDPARDAGLVRDHDHREAGAVQQAHRVDADTERTPAARGDRDSRLLRSSVPSRSRKTARRPMPRLLRPLISTPRPQSASCTDDRSDIRAACTDGRTHRARSTSRRSVPAAPSRVRRSGRRSRSAAPRAPPPRASRRNRSTRTPRERASTPTSSAQRRAPDEIDDGGRRTAALDSIARAVSRSDVAPTSTRCNAPFAQRGTRAGRRDRAASASRDRTAAPGARLTIRRSGARPASASSRSARWSVPSRATSRGTSSGASMPRPRTRSR